jgi:AcrR family transcriptional regulator
MTRPYRLGKRAGQAAETRQRIIDAARDLIVEGGIGGASLDAIARQATTTRTTVYDQFGSRGELLLAVMNDALDGADVRDVRKALQLRDPVQAMRRTIRASCRFWGSEYALFAQVKGLALVDADIAGVDAMKEGVRRGHMVNLVGRLDNDGCLRAGCSRRDAVETLLFVTSFETFDQLHGRSGMSVDAVGTTLVDVAVRALLA